MGNRRSFFHGALLLAWCMSFALRAQEAAPEPASANPVAAAFAAAEPVMVRGPAEVTLGDQATLALPAGRIFIPKAEAGRIIQAMGNAPDAELQGLVVGDGGWFAVIDYTPSGYIKDDEAKDWDVDGMLQNLKDGTAEQNKVRAQQGIPEMELVDWVERPHYDAATHRLVWSLSSKDKGAPADAAQGINYNTYALGREGYISLNLVTSLAEVEAQKPIAQELLAGVKYKAGKGYGDFNSSTDKVAEYGIAALVGGLVAKKLGLLAVIGVFFLKAWKLILIGLAATGGLFGKLLGRKKDTLA